MENPFVEFYGKNNISPVHQDLSNISLHLLRRENLYRILGIPPITFNNRYVLEVGPGGGYNSLFFFDKGAMVDFIEPNPKAQSELRELLKKYRIDAKRWTLFPDVVESFVPDKLFDIVIAEGFIPGLYERATVIQKLRQLVKPDGVIVVTCVDDLSLFFEHLKRILAAGLVENVPVFQEKVRILITAFESHYKLLRYATRPIEDWVTDMFLNPAAYGRMFSIGECIEEFGEEFEFLGSSPSMFTNYNWFKNLNFNHRAAILEQFGMKRHTLLLWDLPDSLRSKSSNEKLLQIAYEIRKSAGCLNSSNREEIMQIIVMLRQFQVESSNIDGRITEAIDEAIHLLLDKDLTCEKVSKAIILGGMVGRTQQYVSLVKRGASF